VRSIGMTVFRASVNTGLILFVSAWFCIKSGDGAEDQILDYFRGHLPLGFS
jgi:hypothetical protein